jgi:O-antigen/teichoic acid export membrane protein
MTTPLEVGVFALAQAISIPIMTFAALNLRAVQVTDVKDLNTFGDFVSLRIVTVVVGFLAILGVILFGGYERETSAIIMLVGLNHCVLITREVFQSYMLKHERMDYVALSQITVGVLSLLSMGVVLYLTRQLALGVGAMLTCRIAILLLWDNYAVRRIYKAIREPASGPLIKFNFSRHILMALAWLALPAALMSVMTRLVTTVPQYYIEVILGTESLGYYAPLAAMPFFGLMAVTSAGSSVLPRLSRMFADRHHGFFKLSAKLALVGLVVGLAGLLVAFVGGRGLITVIFTADYADYYEVFMWLMVYGAISYCAACVGYALHATRWFWIQPVMFTLVLGIVIVGCWIWVPEHGLRGAVMAMIMGRTLQIPVAIGIIAWACAKRPAAVAHE